MMLLTQSMASKKKMTAKKVNRQQTATKGILPRSKSRQEAKSVPKLRKVTLSKRLRKYKNIGTKRKLSILKHYRRCMKTKWKST